MCSSECSPIRIVPRWRAEGWDPDGLAKVETAVSKHLGLLTQLEEGGATETKATRRRIARSSAPWPDGPVLAIAGSTTSKDLLGRKDQ
jgi:hypothetical protein